MRVGNENCDVLKLFLSAVVLFVEAEVLHEINSGPTVDENDVAKVLLDIFMKVPDKVGAALDGHECVEDLFALEEGLKDFDGADGVDVEVGEDEGAAVTQRIEELAAKVGDVHVGVGGGRGGQRQGLRRGFEPEPLKHSCCLKSDRLRLVSASFEFSFTATQAL